MTDQKTAVIRAVKRLNKLTGSDTEADHCEADAALLVFCREVGCPEVADAFLRAAERNGGFWYA